MTNSTLNTAATFANINTDNDITNIAPLLTLALFGTVFANKIAIERDETIIKAVNGISPKACQALVDRMKFLGILK
jgi:hypothetical protein